MTTAHERFYGGSEEIDVTTSPDNYRLAPEGPRVIVVANITGGSPGDEGYLRLPDAIYMRLGGPSFYIINNDAGSENLIVEDAEGGVMPTVIPPTEGAIFTLLNNDDAEGDWVQSPLTSIPFL